MHIFWKFIWDSIASFDIIAPTVQVKIEGSGISQTPGKSYTLTCKAYGLENVNPSVKYQWFKNNGTLTRVGSISNSSILMFHFLRMSDIGWYTCNIIVDYTYLSGPANHTLSSTAFELQFSGMIELINEHN